MVETYGKEEESETTTTNPTTAEDDMTLFLHHLLSTSSSSCSPMPLENSLKQIQTPFLSSSSSSSSLSSSSSDVALALAAGRAAGIIPQSGWEVFCNVKTLHPTPPPPLLHPPDSGNHRRPPLPTEVNRRDVAYTAESSAALDISGDRSASSTANFSLVPTAGDDSDKKAGPFVTDSSNPCSIGSLLDRQDSLCLPSSGGSLGSPVKDLVSGKRRKPPDTDLDDLDCESEEGQEVLEEPSKPVPSRNNLKRSRAAEVHNLSEKRRRSRINEKMKALQNLIPNSNKTDKASMLDEAIEYLKHLQLQVQMLSMRNGLNLSTMYMPGGLQPMQMPQTRMGFGIENDMSTQVNMGLGVGMGVGMLPTNQGPSTHPQFSLSNQCTPSHQPMVVPNLPGVTTSENSFGMDPSRPHLGTTYQLPTAEEIYRVGSGILPHQQFDMIQSGRNHSAENKSKRAVPSLSLDGQAAMLEGGDCLEVCTILHGENSQQMLSGNIDERVLIQHMNDLKTEAIIPDDCVKKEARDF